MMGEHRESWLEMTRRHDRERLSWYVTKDHWLLCDDLEEEEVCSLPNPRELAKRIAKVGLEERIEVLETGAKDAVISRNDIRLDLLNLRQSLGEARCEIEALTARFEAVETLGLPPGVKRGG